VSERARKTGKLLDERDEYERLEAKRLRREEMKREQGKGRYVERTGDDSDGSEEDEDGEDGVGVGAGGKRKRNKHKETADCWYINPRYFVDVVKYRIYLIKTHLQRLEKVGASYKCPKCPFEATLLEAINSCVQKKGESGLEFMCKWCDCRLVPRHSESLSMGSKELSIKFEAQMRDLGIYSRLQALEQVPLGANSPRKLIRDGVLSLISHDRHQETSEKSGHASSQGTSNPQSSSSAVGGAVTGGHKPTAGSGGGSSSLGGAWGMARVFVPVKDDLLVATTEESKDGASKPTASTVVIPAPERMAVDDVPEHLRMSNLTGSTKTFGFVNVSFQNASAPPSLAVAVSDAKAEPQLDDSATAELFALLFAGQGGEGASMSAPMGEVESEKMTVKALDLEGGEEWENF